MAKTHSTPLDFEQSLQQLAGLVDALESDTLSLEQALEHFERGIQLVRHCQTTLGDAEQRVEKVLADGTLQDVSLEG